MTAEDKMWNGIGWYGFIGVITSTTDISLIRLLHTVCLKATIIFQQTTKADDFCCDSLAVIYLYICTVSL